MMDADDAERAFAALARMPHYHVVYRQFDRPDVILYSDGDSYTSAINHVGELISATTELDSVWIAQGAPTGCPLAHGDDGENEQLVDGFLTEVSGEEPFWEAASGDGNF